MEPKIKDEITQELEYSKNVKKKLEIISKHEREKFVSEITNGLGQKIKENNGRVIIKKKLFINRIFDKIKLFFIKF